MRLHCKAVATKADKTSSNSKSQPDARKQVASKPTCTSVVDPSRTSRRLDERQKLVRLLAIVSEAT